MAEFDFAVLAVLKWIDTTLNANATLVAELAPSVFGSACGVYFHKAPQGATFPCAVFGLQVATEVVAMGYKAVATNTLWNVRIIGETESIYGLKALANAMG